MFNVISMFGVKIRLHRSLRILLSLLGLLVLCLLFIRRETPAQKSPRPATDDEEINLVHLFNRAFQLTYQAGQAIRSLKNSQTNLQTFFKKKSFAHLPGEPVTLADLLSHSILSNGLKREFSNLQVIQRWSPWHNHPRRPLARLSPKRRLPSIKTSWHSSKLNSVFSMRRPTFRSFPTRKH